VWACTRDNDATMLKHFFFVVGSRKMLTMHNTDKEEGGKTLLHTACWSGSLSVVAYLLEMGIGVDDRDTAYSMMTPLMYAARARHSNIVILLIKHGANVNLQDRDGNTCLHWASRKGWGSMLVSMLNTYQKIQPTRSRGVLQIRNSRGRTCLEVAKNETVAELVRKRFEDQSSREKKSNELKKRFKVGAKKMINLDGGLNTTAIKNQHRRYGDFQKNRGEANVVKKPDALKPKPTPTKPTESASKSQGSDGMLMDLHKEFDLGEFASETR